MSKYVKSYWAETLPNGVIHLLINLSQREIYYHNFSDSLFLITGTEKEYEDCPEDCILNIEDFYLPEETGMHYITSFLHEKDQLSFYFIPHKREWIKSKKERIFLENEML